MHKRKHPVDEISIFIIPSSGKLDEIQIDGTY